MPFVVFAVIFVVASIGYAAPPTVDKQESKALWFVADDENVGPALEVEAENEALPTVSEQTEANDDRNVTLIFNEEACLRRGGNCLPEIECPHGKLSELRGLCPQQQNLGIECCHGLSLLETRCHARGGQCTDIHSCSRSVVEDRAEDCPDDKVCCVLVR